MLLKKNIYTKITPRNIVNIYLSNLVTNINNNHINNVNNNAFMRLKQIVNNYLRNSSKLFNSKNYDNNLCSHQLTFNG